LPFSLWAAAVNVNLVLQKGRKRKKVVALRPPEAILGRARGCSVRIPSEDVSRRHCRLRLDDDLVTVEDLGSVNGTFLNGQAVAEVRVVQPGDRLEVGPITFIVEYELTAAGRKRLREALARVTPAPKAEEPPPPAAPEPAPAPPKAEDPLAPIQLEPGEGLEEPQPDPVDLDADGTWHAPPPGELRDLLLQFDEYEDAPEAKKKKGDADARGPKK
jgi:predicted component of type VI protein secretion system